MNQESGAQELTQQLKLLLKREGPKLEQAAKEIIKITDDMDESWSGSWAGYHANLYFQQFEQPIGKQRFSTEWGGKMGIDPGWRTRSLSDVWGYISEKSKVKFTTEILEEKMNAIREIAEKLKTILELNTTEQILKDKIAAVDTSNTMAKFINIRKPGSIMSRDSEAILQGVKVPPHIQCFSFGSSIREGLASAHKLIDLEAIVFESKKSLPPTLLIDDGINYLDPKLVKKVGKLYSDKHYTEAVGKAFRVVKDRLREITGYENGYNAFTEGGLYIKGSAAENVDYEFQIGVQRLLGSIDKFRNEKLHTSEGEIKTKEKALSYLYLCNLALTFLNEGNYVIKPKKK